MIRGALLQENYQVFLGLHFGFAASESDEEVTQEILEITKHPAQLRCNLLTPYFVATYYSLISLQLVSRILTPSHNLLITSHALSLGVKMILKIFV